MIRPLIALSIALAAAGFGPACNTSPTGPTMLPPPASRGEPVLRNIELVGPEVVRPGERVQFSLLARMSDGSSRDVTSVARWSSGGEEVSVDQLGGVTGVAVGEALVRAQFDERDGLKVVMVLPDGTYRLTGQVVDADDVFETVPGARVEVTAGVGARQIARTDGSGSYRLYGVAGEIGLRVTADRYQPIERTLVVANHQLFNVRLSYVGPN